MPHDVPAAPRSRRPRNTLTVEAILDAAETVAARGFESLTIRAVATELGASPMALYRYFGTKGELVDALLNRVLGRFLPPPESGDWISELRAFARRHRELLNRHPWAIGALIGHPFPGPNALPIGETALRILGRGGIAGDAAVATFSGIIALNYGWSSFVMARGGDGHAPDPLPPAPPEYPLSLAAAASLASYGSAAHYERVLDQLLAGVEAAAAERARDSPLR
ncbi:TetR/AcrR family transcriptional regulator [Arthrobacter sp. AL12]|uniref:TetR/AcrR family transcriptional regulator n=1 Tax=Arthrobacter sp. AL12 TaxID=3042241 RepID=UPI00249BAC81|nr:TetR/AcrR family transcriptional regulator [Arthrobacter sp. AL12]MDI3212183.1 TetR/AcrR family transcriptional regulator [Arthrobacter sp. AL12]